MADEWASGAERIPSVVEALLRFHTSRRMHLGRAAAARVPLNDSAYVVLRHLSRRGPSSATASAKNTSTQLATTYRAGGGPRRRRCAGDGAMRGRGPPAPGYTARAGPPCTR